MQRDSNASPFHGGLDGAQTATPFTGTDDEEHNNQSEGSSFITTAESELGISAPLAMTGSFGLPQIAEHALAESSR